MKKIKSLTTLHSCLSDLVWFLSNTVGSIPWPVCMESPLDLIMIFETLRASSTQKSFQTKGTLFAHARDPPVVLDYQRSTINDLGPGPEEIERPLSVLQNSLAESSWLRGVFLVLFACFVDWVLESSSLSLWQSILCY